MQAVRKCNVQLTPAEYPVARSDLMTMVPLLAVMVWSEAELELDPYARVKAYLTGARKCYTEAKQARQTWEASRAITTARDRVSSTLSCSLYETDIKEKGRIRSKIARAESIDVGFQHVVSRGARSGNCERLAGSVIARESPAAGHDGARQGAGDHKAHARVRRLRKGCLHGATEAGKGYTECMVFN